MKILFEFISYFFEYKHFTLDILFGRTLNTADSLDLKDHVHS